MIQLVGRREPVLWAGALLAAWALLAVTGFVSLDPDSAFYAEMSARLAKGPLAGVIAPEWGGLWNGSGLWQEHPVGIYLLPIALAKLGYPDNQAAFAVGIATGLACLLLLARLARDAEPSAGRSALVLLQLVPAAFVFRVRANQEYPMLACLLVMLLALDGTRRSWKWMPAVAAALIAALLVKGVFVLVVLLGGGLWTLLNPLRTPGSIVRPMTALAIGLAAMVVTAFIYDQLYLRAAGTVFWAGYWRRQLGPVADAAPRAGALPLVYHAFFYVAHLAWLSAPWGAGLIAAAIGWVTRWRDAWRAQPAALRGAALFALAFAGTAIVMLSPSGRFAERYLFSPIFITAAIGVAAACRTWPVIPVTVAQIERRVPYLPVLVWLVLIVGRLGLGPLLPRPRFW
jgi:4-amino-4-deoxy-L-arabinose transferase-like glycosyltransferase